jgi:chaperonin cofactor prefoldin
MSEADTEVLQRITRVETQLETVSTTIASVDHKLDKLADVKARIDRLEDANRWLWRTVGGTLIAAVIGFIIDYYSGG